jgi:hypothetical protein
MDGAAINFQEEKTDLIILKKYLEGRVRNGPAFLVFKTKTVCYAF